MFINHGETLRSFDEMFGPYYCCIVQEIWLRQIQALGENVTWLSRCSVGKMWSYNKIMIFCPYSIPIIQANMMNAKTLMLVSRKELERVFDCLKNPAKDHRIKSWPWIWLMTSNHLFDLPTVFFFQNDPNEKMNMNLSCSVYYTDTLWAAI